MKHVTLRPANHAPWLSNLGLQPSFGLRISAFGFQLSAWLLALTLFAPRVPAAEPAPPLAALARLPMQEVTVFKDGYGFVAHQGTLPTDDRGHVLLDYLPTPVVGTFWPYVAEDRAKLTGVVASQRRVRVERTALSLRELLEANVGAEAIISEFGTNRYDAMIVSLPVRSSEEQAATNPPNSGERLPEKGNLVLLKTTDGVKAVSIDRIQDVTFKNSYKSAATNEEFRNLLTLKVDWGNAQPAKSAKVGLFYLQKGVRWIPSYKVELDGKGQALLQLQATVLNEMADLQDVSVNLVIGVPTFAFKDTIDPIALQQNLAQLSQYFQTEGAGRNNLIAAQFSNALMTQMPGLSPNEPRPVTGEGGALGPEIGDSGRNEDLFVFKVPHVTLHRGERMVLSLAEVTLPCRDVFTLELPVAPPPEVRGNFNNEQQRELARLFNAPKVMHKVRLTNSSKFPLTTAPALILREARVLAQGMMTYTSSGATVDLPITTVVDFQVKQTDTETKRTPNALQENGASYSRIDLSGKITITSHRPQPAELEITRLVLGAVDTADHDGTVEKPGILESGALDYPYWWNWYGWPAWWNYFNGLTRITWKLSLDPKQTVNVGYDWHYFWR